MKLKQIFILGIFSILTACTSQSPNTNIQIIEPEPSKFSSRSTASVPTNSSNIIIAYYTYPSLDGNHYVRGNIDLRDINPLRITLKGEPAWVVSGIYKHGALWIAALSTGEIQAFYVEQGTYQEVTISTKLAPGEPPALAIQGDDFWLLQENLSYDNKTNHPIQTSGGIVAHIDPTGYFHLDIGNNIFFDFALNALPDTRILQDGAGNFLGLTQPTNEYDHGIAGDQLEANAFAIISLAKNKLSVQETTLPDDKVIEGIYPIWVDLNGDGSREIIVTQSAYGSGAQLVVYNQQGTIVAAGDPIGQSYRWRHQIAVAPFGPEKELELVDVLTPHLGGIVEFFQWQDDKLVLVASVQGYTSHVIGTRNMDMAVAADFDSDNLVELLLPNQQRNSLGAIQRTTNGAIVDWEIELGGTLITNLAVLSLADGSIALGLGLEENTLLIWSP